MGFRIQVSINPFELGIHPSLVLSSVNNFSFESKSTSSVVGGANSLGELLHEKLTLEEKKQLSPNQWLVELELDTVVSIDPRELRDSFWRFYELAEDFLIENEEEAVEAISKSKIYDVGFIPPSPHRFFHILRRDIAGALFMCERGISKNYNLCVTLG